MLAGEFPEAVSYLWHWFLSLHGARGSSGFGPNPISWADMQAFFSLHGLRPTATELDLLRRLDAVALKASAEKPEAEAKADAPKLKPGKPHLRKKRKP